MFEGLVGTLTAILLVAFMVWVIWQIFAIVWEMAEARGHNPWAWMFISCYMSPFGSMFVLWVFFPVDEVNK